MAADPERTMAPSRPPLDAIIIAFNDVPPPPRGSLRAADDPVGYFHRSSYLRIDGKDVEPLTALSELSARTTGRSDFYHWSEAAPLAAHHLTGYLRKRGFHTEMVRFLPAEHERVARWLEERRALSVCILTTFYVDPWPILDAVQFVRRHDPRVKVILGGPFIQDLIAESPGADRPGAENWSRLARSLELLGADIYVRSSQGEQTLAGVLAALRAGGDLGRVPNLAVLEHGRLVGLTPLEPEHNDIDEPLDWDLLSDDELGREVNVRTAAGCAFACSFCDYPVRAGAHRLARLETVEAQLRQLDRRGVRFVNFVDDTFNVPLPRFVELCRTMARNRFSFSWSSFFRASSGQRAETYDLMRDSGCVAVHLGIESGDPRMLALMNKRADARHYEFAIEALNQRAVLSHAALVVGFPGETDESLANTIALLNRAQPTTYKPQAFFYRHHAPVHEEATQSGLEGKGWSWRHATMTSSEAMRAVWRVRDQVIGPHWLGNRLDVFALPWLLCKGVSRTQLLELLGAWDQVQRSSFDHRPNPALVAVHTAAVEQLTSLCARLQLEPSRFSQEAMRQYQCSARALG